ncbi:MAG: T9SS type A sorting domain-containing protein, partial [Bacteroidales bacterium]|nr:T9SS type A sorting domain-containing protein [Bacteroidales bacterium]
NISLVNGLGKEVRSFPYENNPKITINGISPGVYYLKIEMPGKQYIEKVLVK